MLLAGWKVRIGKNCDRGLENAASGRRPRAAFSSPRSQFFTIPLAKKKQRATSEYLLDKERCFKEQIYFELLDVGYI